MVAAENSRFFREFQMDPCARFAGASGALCSLAPDPAKAGGTPIPGSERVGSRVTVSRNSRVTGGSRRAVVDGGR